MNEYLICYWVNTDNITKNLEEIIKADTIFEALKEFLKTHSERNITSISIIPNFIPRFDYEEISKLS